MAPFPDYKLPVSIVTEAGFCSDGFDAGAFADVNCVVDETDESNNAVTESITLTDPNAGLTWNIYRQTGEEGYTMIATASDNPEHLDTTVMGDVEYCYYVTQVLEDDTESDTSNHACATPISVPSAVRRLLPIL